MTDTFPLPGLYVRLGGSEYEVIYKGGWALRSGPPAPGFKKYGGSGYIRPVQPGEKLESYRIAHSGTYRGISVDLTRSTQGRVIATTRDRCAPDAGFDSLGRHDWVKLIARNDPELRFTTYRTFEPGPWLTPGSGGSAGEDPNRNEAETMSALRDTRADAGYFTEVITNLEKFCAMYDQMLAGPDIEGDPLHVLGVQAGDAMKSQWSRFSSLYSLGASTAELSGAFECVLAAAERALRLEKETIPPQMFERRFAFGKNKDFYREWLWLVSVAVALDVDDATFDRVVAAVEIGWADRLIGCLIQTRRPKHALGTDLAFPGIVSTLEKAFDEADPAKAQQAVKRYLAKWYPAWKGTWGWGGHEFVAKKHYWGYWAFEAAGVAAALGLANSAFNDDEHYPVDLISSDPRNSSGE